MLTPTLERADGSRACSLRSFRAAISPSTSHPHRTLPSWPHPPLLTPPSRSPTSPSPVNTPLYDRLHSAPMVIGHVRALPAVPAHPHPPASSPQAPPHPQSGFPPPHVRPLPSPPTRSQISLVDPAGSVPPPPPPLPPRVRSPVPSSPVPP